jgi:predicted RNA-binding Zn ribbon-like protein
MSNVILPPIFVADAMGIDFLNSRATPVDTPVEWLGSGEDLIAWVKAAGLAPADVLKDFKASALPGELDAIAAQARSLREWFRGFVQRHKGKALKAGALNELELLNRILERDETFGQVGAGKDAVPGGSGLVWLEKRRWRSPESLLLPIAREIATVICNEDFRLIRTCEGHACTLTFIDRTKSHRRRWCSMAVCGNRAKQAALRERLR